MGYPVGFNGLCTEDNQFTHKKYCDLKLLKTGGTLTGPLVMSNASITMNGANIDLGGNNLI